MLELFTVLRRDVVQYGLTLSGLWTRLVGASCPPVLANSIPRAGTNLLLRALYLHPRLHRRLQRTSNNDPLKRLTALLQPMQQGQVVAAHLYHEATRAALLNRFGVCHVLMVRHPRDIVVSNLVYLTRKDPRHRLHAYYNRLQTNAERIQVMLVGIPAHELPDGCAALGLDRQLMAVLPWFQDPACLIVRYENLVGPHGGGTADRQRVALRALYAHTGLEGAEEKQVETVRRRLFSRVSRTFNRMGYTSMSSSPHAHD
ncbi:MAG: hypothetical protein AAGI71_09100 [Bacteroidota bacterium]